MIYLVTDSSGVTEPVEGHGGWYIEAESIDEMARMINEVAR